MKEPRATRPFMPGYGTLPPTDGGGLLPWSWAEERLASARDYWVASILPDGRPHVMPVWGVWLDDALWFSSAVRSRKARNLAADPRCTMTTDVPTEPVVVHGTAAVIIDLDRIATFLDALGRKYATAYDPDFLDPAVNASFRLEPEVVFGLVEENFTGSPTRWAFDA
jgi:PPOX class probable F420-dependent enzyme